ncbi:hypothetical protein D915_004226 [Fasciola hepatica]|uniref:Uncharacterized protein n=1 Tax=Fasciola hepatica TaxID=6192 RepID=A0A4E0R856_FASHE|nr:hypothetical protein D915_004226 [Fasciola hepatica]
MHLILGRKSKSVILLLFSQTREINPPIPTRARRFFARKVLSWFSDSFLLACDDIAETFVTLANEPSLAYFRIQEHVRKSTPTLLEERSKIANLQAELQGKCFDLDYAIGDLYGFPPHSAVESACRATSHLIRLNELLKSGLFTKLQLDYAQRQSANLEMGVDAITFFGDTVPVASPIRPVKHQRESGLEHPPSSGFELPATSAQSFEKLTSVQLTNCPRVSVLAGGASSTAVEVRQRAVDLTRRVLFTRSADILSADFGDFRSALLPEVTESTDLNETRHRPSYESLLQSDPERKPFSDTFSIDKN